MTPTKNIRPSLNASKEKKRGSTIPIGESHIKCFIKLIKVSNIGIISMIYISEVVIHFPERLLMNFEIKK